MNQTRILEHYDPSDYDHLICPFCQFASGAHIFEVYARAGKVEIGIRGGCDHLWTILLAEQEDHIYLKWEPE